MRNQFRLIIERKFKKLKARLEGPSKPKLKFHHYKLKFEPTERIPRQLNDSLMTQHPKFLITYYILRSNDFLGFSPHNHFTIDLVNNWSRKCLLPNILKCV